MFNPSGELEAQKRRLGQAQPAQLAGLFGRWLDLNQGFGAPKRLRLYSPSRMFWLFLSQVLSPDGSCREVLRGFLIWLALEHGKGASVRTTAYCKARAKLKLKDIQNLNRQIVRKVSAMETAVDLWCGRKVKVIDGSSVSMPDTRRNQCAWPQTRASRPGCGFPVMRLVAIFSLASGAMLALASGSIHAGERALLRKLWRFLKPGDVALGDRGFCSYAEFFLLAARGVDSVTRKNSRRVSRVLKKLGRNDHLTEWGKNNIQPAWVTEKQWEAMPEKMVVREITVSVGINGFRTRKITIATTLTDPVAYPAPAFADLYLKRWRVELYLKDIKITMGMDILRCKTPEMVAKELWMRVIAYNLIRAVMRESAISHGDPQARLSFKGALATIRQWTPALSGAGLDDSRRQVLYGVMLDYIARDLVPLRPNRTEPRARKRRPKGYQLLNKPRKLFREIQHRSKYARA
jgi:hypothetical protein